MNLWQTIGLTLMLYMVGGVIIVSSDIPEPSQAAYLILLGIGGLCLMLGGAKNDIEH